MTQPQSGHLNGVASVLVIAADPNIASLCGELVAFAGHRPKHDFTNGVAGESVRIQRPDVALIDAALDCTVVQACIDACDEVRARPVLTSSTAAETELVENAQSRGCIPFPLPGRPQRLGFILDRIVGMRTPASVVPPAPWREQKPLHPAFCAAIARMARARSLSLRAEQLAALERFTDNDMQRSLDAVRRSREALRAAIHDFARDLYGRDVPRERMLDMVEETLCECAAIVGAEAALEPLGDEWRTWALDAYRAA